MTSCMQFENHKGSSFWIDILKGGWRTAARDRETCQNKFQNLFVHTVNGQMNKL